MSKPDWILDSLGQPYVLEQYPGKARKYPWTAYDEVPPFDVPSTWEGIRAMFTVDLGGPLRKQYLEQNGNVNTWEQCLWTKDHVRQHRTMNPLGYICWVRFTWRPHAWVVVDDWEGTTIVPDGEYTSRGFL